MSYVDIFANRTELYTSGQEHVFLNFELLQADPESFDRVLEGFSNVITPLRPDVIVAHEHHHVFSSALRVQLKENGLNTGLIIAHERSTRYPGAKYNFGTLEIGARVLDRKREDLGRIFRAVFVDDVVVSGSDAIAVAEILPQARGQLVGICCLAEFPNARLRLNRRIVPIPMTSLVTFSPDEGFGPGLSSESLAASGGRMSPQAVDDQVRQRYKAVTHVRPRSTHRYQRGPGF